MVDNMKNLTLKKVPDRASLKKREKKEKKGKIKIKFVDYILEKFLPNVFKYHFIVHNEPPSPSLSPRRKNDARKKKKTPHFVIRFEFEQTIARGATYRLMTS